MPERICVSHSRDGSQARRVTRLALRFATLLLLASPASALDFSSENLVYREDYQGETAFPTTPEIDLVAVGVGVGSDFPNTGGAPTLAGGAAHVSVIGAASPALEIVGFSGGTLGAGDVGLRGRFEGLAMAGDGTAAAAVGSFFDFVQVFARLDVSRSGAVESATLTLTESDQLTPPVTSVLGLPPAEAVALLGGAAFTIDLFVDRAGVALASVRVAGFPGASDTRLALTVTGAIPLSSVLQAGGYDPAERPSSVQLDMTSFELYSALPRSFNVDVGDAFGTPSPAYGAAGLAGTWTTIGLGTTSLTDFDDNPTGASATLTTQSAAGGFVGGTPDEQAFLGDHAFECVGNPDVWTLSFSGLAEGRYRVFVYAPANNFVHTGAMDVNGAPLGNLSGDSGFALIRGTSWDSVDTTAPGGVIHLSGTEGTTLCAGIAGVQLVALPPEKVPSLTGPLPALLAGLLVFGGAAAARDRTSAR